MSIDKQGVYNLLATNNIDYEAVEHDAVFTVEEMNALDLPHPESVAKNLFLRDDKKRTFYLLVMPESKQVNLKEVRAILQSRPLSFASEKYLEQYLSLTRGAVSPFGAFNDADNKVLVYFDKEYEGKLIGCHPNDNTASVFLQTNELATLIRQHGNSVEFIEL